MTRLAKTKKIMIIAAEASSAQYAVKLMTYFNKYKSDYKFFGVGTKQMEDMGFERIGKSEEMAIVGLTEVIKHLPFLKGIFNGLVQKAIDEKPDAVILMDYPDFNLRLAKKLSGLGMNVFYYISPQVWAWRKSRIHDIKKYCKKVFLLFPFEKKFYNEHQVPNEFVGHPLLEDLNPKLTDKKYLEGRRSRYGITSSDKVLAIMPGSRKGEIEKNFKTQLEAATIVSKKFENLKIVICVAPTLEKDYILSHMEDFKPPYILLKEDPNEMIAMSDVALVASGTATLMVGLLEKPMVIMYKMSGMTYRLAKILVKGVDIFGLVNLVHEKKVVPELLQHEANPVDLAQLIGRYLSDQAFYDQTVNALKETRVKLGQTSGVTFTEHDTPTARVAEAIDHFIEKGT